MPTAPIAGTVERVDHAHAQRVLEQYGFAPPARDEIAELLGQLPGGVTLPQVPSSLPTTPTIPSIPSSLPVAVPGGFQDPTGAIAQYAQSQGLVPTDPDVAGYIASIQQAAEAEGLPAAGQDVMSRVQTFATAYSQLYNSPGLAGAGNAVQTALTAARQYVTQNHELSGAIATVSSLVQAFQAATSGNSTPQDIVAAFTGPVITAAVTAGAVTAGVGAAIVGLVAIAAALLDKAGFLAATPGVQICPSFSYTGGGQPTFAINCMAVFDLSQGGALSPASVNWRHFPNPNNAADAWWFQVIGNPEGTFTTWNQAKWIPVPPNKYQGFSTGSERPIDAAFPVWPLVLGTVPDPSDPSSGTMVARNPTPVFQVMSSVGTLPANLSSEQLSALVSFDACYSKAWEATQEYWLNGHKGPVRQSDGQPDDGLVLQHAAELWNRAHAEGQGVWVDAPANVWQETTPTLDDVQAAVYWSIFVPQVSNAATTDILTGDGKKLYLHTGPAKDASAQGIPSLGTKIPTAAQGSSSSAAPAVVGTAIVGLAVAGAWFALGKPMTWAAIKAALGAL